MLSNALLASPPLRRLHRLANEENAQQRKDALWAFRIGLAFVAVLALILLVSLLRH
jgi:tetrahydromethanopterin S-methyltransferase subunit B